MGSLADCELLGIFVLSGDFYAALAVILASNCWGLSDLAGQYLLFEVVSSGDWQSCELYCILHLQYLGLLAIAVILRNPVVS